MHIDHRNINIDLGARLAALREEGVLILASGNLMHNLRAIEWSADEEGFDWAQRWDDDARTVLTKDPTTLSQLGGSDDYRLAGPTPDHFLPLAYFAGPASASSSTPSAFVQGCTMGSLSMTSYVVR